MKKPENLRKFVEPPKCSCPEFELLMFCRKGEWITEKSGRRRLKICTEESPCVICESAIEARKNCLEHRRVAKVAA